MNKFILFAFQIINMGGEQQYCRNKLKVMSDFGYETNLFSCDEGTIFIDELKNYAPNTIKELRYPPFCFSHRKVKKIVEYIAQKIGRCSPDSIIESVNPATAEWAELVAKRLGCKHIVFLLDEYFTISKTEYNFFWFKYLRNELMGIATQTLQMLFKKYKKLSDDESFWFDAACSNVVEDVPCNLPWYKNIEIDNHIKIGTIGRLEKGFVIPCLKETAKYIKNNNKIIFDVVLIGGSDDSKQEKNIKKIFKDVKNANLYFTGYLYPIPKDLLLLLDVCFSTAGSALITGVDYDIPTISVDTFTGQPIGILNYTTKENMYANKNNSLTISLLFDEILINKYCDSHEKLDMEKTKNDETFKLEVKRQLQFINDKKNKQDYFNTQELVPDSLKYDIYRFIGKVFGTKVLNFVHIKCFHFFKMIIKGNARKTY